MSTTTTSVAPIGVVPPPPGQTANFVDPPTNEGALIPIVIIFTILSTTFMALRLYTKAYILKLLGWEDLAMTIAWGCTILTMGCYIRAIQLGSASHIWNITFANYHEYGKITAATVTLYSTAIGLPKIAILLFFLRINPDRTFRICTFILMGLVTAYILGISFGELFQCNPIQKWWEPWLPGKCIDAVPIYITIPVAGTILDLLILMLPIPMIYRLHATRRTKIAVGAIFSICSCTTIVSASRIPTMFHYLGTTDPTWDASTSLCQTAVELNMMNICGSILVLRPFCIRYFPNLFSGGSKDSDQTPDMSKWYNVKGTPNYAGPLGPRSKSRYRTEVSGGGSKTPGGNSGKRSWWNIEFGSTSTRSDEEDLDSLDAELRRLPPTAAVIGGITAEKNIDGTLEGDGENAGGEYTLPAHERETGNTHGGIGVAESTGGGSGSDHDLESGIVKTVSLDVR